MQSQLSANGYTAEQVSAYAEAGGLPYLDNTDTVFGQVYQGMDVVDKMACVDTVQNEDGTDSYRPTEEGHHHHRAGDHRPVSPAPPPRRSPPRPRPPRQSDPTPFF